ncbi:GSCOCG00001614001-RA-CDS [Cotesia congregata]|nr:GSCOCG00001614001-RA-CDS [Cotesia congregata]
MDIREELNKKLVLEKPAQVPQFKTNKKKKNKKSDDNKKVKSYARNEHLYESLESDISDFDTPVKMKTESEIRSRILEINGGKLDDTGIVKKWKKAVDADGKDTDIAKKSKENYYKRNPLMRGLLDKKLASLKVADIASSESSSSGKGTNNIDVNNEDVEIPYLMQSTEEPDVFVLRDTTKRDKDKDIDNDFKFSYRGIKKTTTPRRYAIYELTSEDFAFTKKLLMVKNSSSDHLIDQAFVLNFNLINLHLISFD